MATERKERRAHPRAHLTARVEVEAEGRSFLAVIRNISAGGMRIFTANPAPLHERLRLTFDLPDHEKPVRVAAEVRNVVEGTSMGVQFQGLAAEDAAAIRAFVEKSHRAESAP